jgi:hypothetical protein
MNIDFEDNSFLNLSIVEGNLRLTLCGMKSKHERTMTSVDLDKEQLKCMIQTMQNFIDGKLICI